mgnify:CR=1 FL=1
MFIRTERSVKDFMRFYPIVSTIVIINLLLWLMIYVLQLQIGYEIYHLGIGHNLSVHYGEYWRILTPIFLHGGLSHVLFNSFALVLFGPALEQMLGKFRFILAYLLTGIAGNLGTYIIDPTSIVPHLGASGAVYGLFGIYLYMVFFRKDLIDRGNARLIQIIFVIGLIMTFLQPNVNIAAHIFGFLGGFAIGPIVLINTRPFSMARNYERRRFDDDEVQFDPNRWKRRKLLPRKLTKNIFWIILGIIVVIGFVSRYF